MPTKSQTAYLKKKSPARRKKNPSLRRKEELAERQIHQRARRLIIDQYMVINPFYVCLDLFLGFEKCRDHIVWFWLELCFDFVKNLSRDHHCFVVSLVLSVRSFKTK